MLATRKDLFARFTELGIAVETHRHPPVFTVAEAKALRGELPGGHTKNLFLKDKKGAALAGRRHGGPGDRPEGAARQDRGAAAVVCRRRRCCARCSASSRAR